MVKSMMMSAKMRSQPNPDPNVQDQRLGLEEMTRMLPIAPNVDIENVIIRDIRAELIAPRAIDNDTVIVYFHGGSYTAGSPATHRSLVSRICATAKLKAYVVDYRLAPEHPYPSAIIDGVDFYLGLLEDGLDPNRIVLGGDSAGGGLCLAILFALRERGIELPKGLFLLSPWTDLTASGDSVQLRSELDPWLRPDGLVIGAKAYLNGADPKDPKASPIFGDYTNFPDTLLMVGTEEILYDDTVRIYDKMREVDVNAVLKIGEGLWHVWPAFAMLPESNSAIDDISSFINSLPTKAK